MKEHGIMFRDDMVRAIIQGRKTVTRRLSKRWLKVKKGDLLWVKEVWGHPPNTPKNNVNIVYKAEGRKAEQWRPSLLMPRLASRIDLIVIEDARLERLQNITIDEIYNEGIPAKYNQSGREEFINLWNSIHKPGNRWEDNPEVVRIAFELERVGMR